MISVAEKHKNVIEESVAQLLSRAANSRGLQIGDLAARIGLALEKYLFKANENVGHAEIKEFIDSIRADDLCLIVACERGDETAWSDLVKSFNASIWTAIKSSRFCENICDKSFFNWIHEKTNIQTASKVRSAAVLMLHCWGKLAVAFFLLVFNL